MIIDDYEPWLQVLGRAHPLVLHLPIGLWIGIAALEFGGALVRRPASRPAIVTLSWLAALGGGIAVATGWILAAEGDHSSKVVDPHRWFGVAMASIGLLTAVFACFRARQGFRLLLLIELAVMVPTGHLGSEMTHGRGFLLDPLGPTAPTQDPEPGIGPADADPAATDPTAADPTSADPTGADPNSADPTGADPAGAVPAVATHERSLPSYSTAIAPLLRRLCTKCHGEDKHKSDLRLDSISGIQAGGKGGPVFVAGDPERSELLRRLALPIDDEDHMPPEDKPQPTADEQALLRAWITAGAPFGGTFAHAGPAPGTTDPAPPPPAPKTPVPAPGSERPDGDDKHTAEKTDRDAAALAALRARLVHVAAIAAGDDGLEVDFAAVAPTATDDEVRALLAPLLPRIVRLSLARAPIGDPTLADCARMPRLERLDLRATAISSSGLQKIAALPALCELVLAQTRLDDTAADSLLQLPALERVYVWNAGLGAAALQRLRARPGLTVDDGEPGGDAALETEGELRFANELPPFGQPAAPAPAAAALRPVNDVCPVSGKPIDARYVVVHEQRLIGFCCPRCAASFWAAPADFAIASR